ncbi:hypothetical protein FQR65_LT16633 [Abscondita terminalis]|nr:hypothetical protein FQR65_LT16633 [Abscondita terminalis]
MSWSWNEVNRLIEEFQKYPCLYATKSANYKNKHARITALNNIKQALETFKPEISITDIKGKFHALKCTFLTEHRKHEASLSSGAGGDTVYTPTLWYFDKISFILEHQTPRQSTDSYSLINETETESQNEIEDDDVVMEYEIQDDNTLKVISKKPSKDCGSSLYDTPSTSRSSSPSTEPKKRKQNNDVTSEITGAMTQLTNAIVSKQKINKQPRKYSEFANFVQSKMNLT